MSAFIRWIFVVLTSMGWVPLAEVPATLELRPSLPVVLVAEEQAAPVAFLVRNYEHMLTFALVAPKRVKELNRLD